MTNIELLNGIIFAVDATAAAVTASIRLRAYEMKLQVNVISSWTK